MATPLPPTTMPVLRAAYDPARDGPPTWPDNVPNFADFPAAQKAFLDWNAKAGLVVEVSPGTFTNAIPFGPTLPTPQQARDIITEARASLPAGVGLPPDFLPALYATQPFKQLEAAGNAMAFQPTPGVVTAPPVVVQAGGVEGVILQLLEQHKTAVIAGVLLFVAFIFFLRR